MITVMQAADAGHSHDLGGPPRPWFGQPESRRLLLEGIMNPIVMVQLNNTTPIVLSAEKSVTCGTPGMAGRFGFMNLWCRRGKPSFGAVSKRTPRFVTS